MNATELRALQAPLKQRYRIHPEAARVTSHAELTLDPANLMVHLGPGPRVAGLHPATGGTTQAACSADMLLEALAACAGVTLLAVAAASGVELRSGTVIAEGHWDARGTLAVDKAVPVGMRDITVTFDLETSVDRTILERLVKTSERYCVILATLQVPAKVSVRLRNEL